MRLAISFSSSSMSRLLRREKNGPGHAGLGVGKRLRPMNQEIDMEVSESLLPAHSVVEEDADTSTVKAAVGPCSIAGPVLQPSLLQL